MPAPKQVIELVQRFKNNIEAYKSGTYNETQVRVEFIDPFFEALGWDVHNKKGYAEAYKDVIHEDAIKIGGFTKAPDYCFRVGGVRKFFLEAKKPSINIKEQISPAYQLRRYAWSAKLPLSILTDFEELAVYDCRVKPVKTDKASSARVLYFTFDQYIQRWDELVSIFSQEAILKGSFDKYIEKSKLKRGTAEVDTAFLKEIENWRMLLARNIALRNKDLTQRELNFAVQQTLDRIIFLRICEDRGIDEYNRLLSVTNGENIYKRLCVNFKQADDKYNSGLFHFKQEGDREAPDELTLDLEIDDKPLKEIIKSLYYPDCPYEFSVLPSDILGHVYEQFLGKVIRLTKGHQAVVEDKPEVKKAGGVYYTPTYIVDYIVKNTVGKLLENKTPQKAKDIKILDPACGSGSFLIGAYQYLLDWHRDWYTNKDPEKYSKSKNPKLFKSQSGEWQLITAEKKQILLDNIFGVDIDSQAVEVTKLSLLLKVLEGESRQTLSHQLKMFHERALPDLDKNIKCGNSLIGPDFYTSRQATMFDDEESYRINVFDWNAEFPEIMKTGGFDAVIGNPPYVRQETLGDFKNYFQTKYKTYHGVADLYTYFIEKGVLLLKPDGLFSYIVANKWMRANYGKPLREWMKQQHIVEIIDFGDLPVFEKATTYPCILCIANKPPADRFDAVQVKTLIALDLPNYVPENRYSIKQDSLQNEGWSLTDEKTQKFLNKLNRTGISLGEYVNNKIYRGILTGLNEAFVIDAETRNNLIKENPGSSEIIKPFLFGRNIKRYQSPNAENHLILIPKGWTAQKSGKTKDAWKWLQDTHPGIASHLEPFSAKAQKRYDKGEYWWELRACDYYGEFEKPKLMLPDISLRGNFSYDSEGSFYCVNTAYIIPSEDKYLLGILNSSLVSFFYRNISPAYRGGYLRFIYQYLVQIPVRSIDLSAQKEKEQHDSMINLVDKIISLNKQLSATRTAAEKNILQRQIDVTDKQIDMLVYELYGLTDEEIKIVKNA